ncbi:hypothetical protein TRM7557_01676 [Tritonibacter multivorans]|uniref:Integral membrane protein n=1 Tax=Tritonibacter multivorans TaxID=928856 RepID=A0A0P1G8Z1_9RHOB|nr:hypothetical protein [Tritonibacter multivorans]MDA7421737.1 hypothetical protein [Tritonibacter multivorans]CUH77999.1 hypothetical protein TRM7557_01676 [Tritonibacter multivorans]SFD04217.1 hypothetical protein SAMN04488049_10650 [Tritonibacter multivorans]
MRLPLILTLCLAPVLAHAQMSAEDFERYTSGRTLIYGQGGQAYGAERYLPGRRVTWSFLDGECNDGIWYPQDGNICFLYEDRDAPQCWQFTETATGLIARFAGEDSTLELYEARETQEDMICLGPEVGV